MVPVVAIPALVAFVFKLGLIGYTARSPGRSVMTYILLSLLAVFAFYSLVEFVGFCIFAGEVTPLLQRFGIAYFACTILAAALILHASLRIGCDFPRNKTVWVEVLLYAPAAILLYLLFATDLLVPGFQVFHNTILRIPGPLYRLAEVYLPGYILISLACLGYGTRGSRPSAVRRARSGWWLFALAPLAILVGYLIVANHYGVARITSTIYAPIPWLIFLTVATLATHRYRLLDPAFFVPGSTVRRRKKALYDRIDSLASRIDAFGSNGEILSGIASAFGCSAALAQSAPNGAQSPTTVVPDGDTAAALTRFPPQQLRSVERIVVAEEIESRDLQLHALMINHRVGAIVPINSNRGTSRWVLLGEEFENEVCTPLDFRHVEALFDRIGAIFREEMVPLRSELARASGSLQDLRTLLGHKWQQQAELRDRLEIAEAENRRLLDEIDDEKEKAASAAQPLPLPLTLCSRESLEGMLVERRCTIARAVLRAYPGVVGKIKVARLLGMSLKDLDDFIAGYGLDA